MTLHDDFFRERRGIDEWRKNSKATQHREDNSTNKERPRTAPWSRQSGERRNWCVVRVQQAVHLCVWVSPHIPVEKVERVFNECSQQHVLEGQGREVVVEEENTRDGKVWQSVHSPASQQEGACEGQLEELACGDSGRDMGVRGNALAECVPHTKADPQVCHSAVSVASGGGRAEGVGGADRQPGPRTRGWGYQPGSPGTAWMGVESVSTPSPCLEQDACHSLH